MMTDERRRITDLLATPAAVRFVSAEPLLGTVNFLVTTKEGHDISALMGIGADPTDPEGSDEYYRTGKLDGIIVGGESGRNARPMHPQWARDIRDQCRAAGTAFFFKQWGEYVSVSEVEGPGDHHRFSDGATVRRTGKKRAGRTLDGVTHDGMPT